MVRIYLGGEAEVRIHNDIVEKIRRPKRYRIEELDRILRRSRTRTEAKLISLARRNGVPTPLIHDVENDKITMENVKGEPLKNCMTPEISREVGRMVARLHVKGIIHGDITPMNLIWYKNQVYFIDFGLSFVEDRVEPKGVDIHVYSESLIATFDNWQDLRESFIEGYNEYEKADEVLARVHQIEERGRYIERVESQA